MTLTEKILEQAPALVRAIRATETIHRTGLLERALVQLLLAGQPVPAVGDNRGRALLGGRGDSERQPRGRQGQGGGVAVGELTDQAEFGPERPGELTNVEVNQAKKDAMNLLKKYERELDGREDVSERTKDDYVNRAVKVLEVVVRMVPKRVIEAYLEEGGVGSYNYGHIIEDLARIAQD